MNTSRLKTVRRSIAIACAAVVSFVTLANAAQWTSGGVTWTFDVSDGKATITGATGYGATLTIPVTVYDGSTSYTVTAVGDDAFNYEKDSEVTSITSVTIPGNVKALGYKAFYKCSNLATVNISNGVETLDYYVFAYTKLTTVYVPDSVTSLDRYVFRDCTSLTSVSLPYLFKDNLPIGLFTNCSSLDTATGVTYRDPAWKDANNVTWYFNVWNESQKTVSITNATGFGTELVIPDTVYIGNTPYTVASIWQSAFEGKTSLRSVVIPYTVISIERYAFRNCTSLTSVSMSCLFENGLGPTVFEGCPSNLVITYNDYVWRDANNVRWQFRFIDGKHTITGASGYGDEDVALVIPDTVYLNSEPIIIQAIGDNAFDYDKDNGLRAVTSVTIPDSVETIGNHAFDACLRIASLTLGEGVETIGEYAFRCCYSLRGVVMPDSLREIGEYAFHSCDNMTTLDLGEGVETIGTNAFSLTKLSSVTVPDSVKTIGEYAFENCGYLESASLPASFEGNLPSSVFYNCTRLGAVTYRPVNWIFEITDDDEKTVAIKGASGYGAVIAIPETVYVDGTAYTVTEIYQSAFDEDYHPEVESIRSVTIPDSVTTIGDYAFYECTNLCTVTIGDGVKSIGYQAFYGCSSLTSVSLPYSLYAPANVFVNCNENLEISYRRWYFSVIDEDEKTAMITGASGYGTSLVIPRTVYDSDVAYTVTAIADHAFEDKTSIESVTIPNSVTNIGGAAFYGCYNMVTLNLGDGIKGISYSAFYNCTSLAALNLSEGVETIGDSAFVNCIALTSVTVPDSVTNIENQAFANCSSLTEVSLPARFEGNLGYNVFQGCSERLFIDYRPVKWSFTITDEVARTAKVTGAAGYGRELEIPETVDVDDAAYTVTAIDAHAFEGDTYIESVEMPDGLLEIGEYAFYGCSNLQSASLPLGAYGNVDRTAFAECGYPEVVYRGMPSWTYEYGKSWTFVINGDEATITGGTGYGTEIEIPRVVYVEKTPYAVTAIGASAFDASINSDAQGIESVIVPDCVAEIGDYAFGGCSSLASASLPGGFRNTLDDSVFQGCNPGLEIIYRPVIEWTFETSGDEATITGASGYGTALEIPETVYVGTTPYTVTAIADGAFFGEQDITSVTIPDSVREIGAEAFYICSSLATLGLGEGVEALGNYAFGATALANVTIPDSVTVIGSSAFGECSSLATLNLGENLETIGESAFFSTALTNVTIPDSVTEIGERAFYECTNLTTLSLGDGVQTIGADAFHGCTNLTNVAVPDSVTEIGQAAFYGCSGLTTLDLGEGVETIGSNAFNGCISLTTVTVPGSVLKIGETAFYGCTRLATLVLEEGVETICDRAFYCCSSLNTVTVPSSVSEIGRFTFSSTSLATVYVSSGDKSRVKELIEESDWTIFIDDIVFVDPAEAVIHSATIGGSTWYYHIIDDEAVLCRDAKNDPAVSPAPTGVLEIPAELGGYDVVAIGYAAFAGIREGLTDVIIPEGVTSIGEQAFYGCSATSVTMPETLERIENNAFKYASLATVYVTVGRTDEIRDMLIDSGFDISGVIFVEPSPSGPSIPGDSGAEVTGDPENGYTIVPSATSGTIEVSIPDGVAPEKVTVVVPPTASVKPNGAKVRVVKKVDETPYDITEFLDIPAPNASGVVDLSAATVKQSVADDVLDTSNEEVEIDLTPSSPSITTANTKPGLTYVLLEGTSLEGMAPGKGEGKTKVGDGNPWTPTLSTGGQSRFYSIGVTK